MRYPLILVAGALAALAPAQNSSNGGSAAGTTHFLMASETGPGGVQLSSATYLLVAGFGSGVTAQRTATSTHVLEGGFWAAAAASPSDQPWATEVRPRFTKLRGGTTHTVHGTSMNLATTVVVPDAIATIVTKRPHELQFRVGPLARPGWSVLRVTSATAHTGLAYGLGVLPMIETPRPPINRTPFTVRYRGVQGDRVVWIFAANKSPVVFPLPGFGHGLELEFASLFVTAPSTVTDGRGWLEFMLPSVAWTAPVWMQAFALTTDPGYSPGSFTNAQKLDAAR